MHLNALTHPILCFIFGVKSIVCNLILCDWKHYIIPMQDGKIASHYCCEKYKTRAEILCVSNLNQRRSVEEKCFQTGEPWEFMECNLGERNGRKKCWIILHFAGLVTQAPHFRSIQ